MGMDEYKNDLLRAVKKDDIDNLRRLLEVNPEIIKNEFGLELLEASISQRKCNRFKCTVYLINQNIDPTRLSEVGLIYGISPLHSISLLLSNATHLTDKEQCEFLNAIITYEIKHDCSPMMTLKMGMLFESTPYESLNSRQQKYYTQTKQQYLTALTEANLPSMPLPFNNHAKSNRLSDLTHYLFSFMYRNREEKENQNSNIIEMKQKKCE